MSITSSKNRQVLWKELRAHFKGLEVQTTEFFLSPHSKVTFLVGGYSLDEPVYLKLYKKWAFNQQKCGLFCPSGLFMEKLEPHII